jgi:hydrogenase assembly chaperone HypC/HupF
MCLTLPGLVTQVQGPMAEIESGGRRDWYNALAQPDVRVGDYVLTHANLIVAIISQEEADRMREAADEVERRLQAEDDAERARQSASDNAGTDV